jgi:hypothetical protein
MCLRRKEVVLGNIEPVWTYKISGKNIICNNKKVEA